MARKKGRPKGAKDKRKRKKHTRIIEARRVGREARSTAREVRGWISLLRRI